MALKGERQLRGKGGSGRIVSSNGKGKVILAEPSSARHLTTVRNKQSQKVAVERLSPQPSTSCSPHPPQRFGRAYYPQQVAGKDLGRECFLPFNVTDSRDSTDSALNACTSNEVKMAVLTVPASSLWKGPKSRGSAWG